MWARLLLFTSYMSLSPPCLDDRAQGELMVIDRAFNVWNLPCGDVSSAWFECLPEERGTIAWCNLEFSREFHPKFTLKLR